MNIRESVKLSDLIVAIPAFHIFVTTLFIAGYYFALNPNVALLASPSDLFSVSVKDIGTVYLFAMALPAVTALTFRARVGAWTYAGSVAQKASEEEKAPVRQRWEASRTTYRFLLVLFLVFYTALAVIETMRAGYLNYSAFYMYILIVFMAANIWFHNRLETPDFAGHLTFIVGAVLIYALFSGLGQGQKDRHLVYKQAESEQRLTCGSYRVLRPVGSYFVAVGSAGHAIIGSSCSPRFTF